jgi:hypothetical protein
MPNIMDESELLDKTESEESDRRTLEARVRAGGIPIPQLSLPQFEDDCFARLKLLKAHNENLRQLLSRKSGRAIDDSPSSSAVAGIPNSLATSPVSSSSNPPGRKLTATERCKLAIAHSQKPEVIAAAEAVKSQRKREYFDRKARERAGRPLTATEKLLKAEGVESFEALKEKRQKAREEN